MKHQLGDFTDLVMTQGFSLASGGIERNDDLAQKRDAGWHLVAIRERQDIGRSILPAITPIELANPFIPGDQNMDLCSLDPQSIQAA